MLFHKKRTVPQLNTTSTADISFMLLILFLVTTSMDMDKGLDRQLPPYNPKEEQTPPSQVNKDMILRLHLTAQGEVSCNDKITDLTSLEKQAIDFITYTGPKHTILLSIDRNAPYDVYYHLQDMLIKVYRTIRNSEAQRRYHHTFDECKMEEQQKIMQIVPQRIMEDLAKGTQASSK